MVLGCVSAPRRQRERDAHLPSGVLAGEIGLDEETQSESYWLLEPVPIWASGLVVVELTVFVLVLVALSGVGPLFPLDLIVR